MILKSSSCCELTSHGPAVTDNTVRKTRRTDSPFSRRLGALPPVLSKLFANRIQLSPIGIFLSPPECASQTVRPRPYFKSVASAPPREMIAESACDRKITFSRRDVEAAEEMTSHRPPVEVEASALV